MVEHTTSEPYFLYRVSIYKITKDMVALIDSRYYKSNKAIDIKKDTVIKKRKTYLIAYYVDTIKEG